MEDKDPITNALDAMWSRFLPEIRERVLVLNSAAAAAQSGKLDDNLRGAAQSAAHKLAGTLGTFGLHRGTELARELEVRFARGGIGVTEAAAIARVTAEMRSLIEARG